MSLYKEHPVLKYRGNLRFIFPLEGGQEVFLFKWVYSIVEIT